MTDQTAKPRRLADVVKLTAPEGANDTRWFLIEHQLMQAKLSLQIAIETLEVIQRKPENDDEKMIAHDCLDYVRKAYIALLQQHSALLAYLSDTDIPDRIGRKEV